MLDRTITGALLIVGIIHLLPMTGYLGASKLSALYNITIDDPNLEILMRHRAVLFGVLGSLFIYAAFQPNVQPFAFFAGYASVLSFFYLSYSVGNFNQAVEKVIVADVIALIALIFATAIYVYQQSRLS